MANKFCYFLFQNPCLWNSEPCPNHSGNNPTWPTPNHQASSTLPCHPYPSMERMPQTWPQLKKFHHFQAHPTHLTHLNLRWICLLVHWEDQRDMWQMPIQIFSFLFSTPLRRKRPKEEFTLSEGEGNKTVKTPMW